MYHKCGLGKKECSQKRMCCRMCEKYEDCTSNMRCVNRPEVCGLYYSTAGERTTKAEMKMLSLRGIRISM